MTYVEYKRELEPEDCQHLSDRQWLRLVELVGSSDPRWAWAMPQEPGDPVRVMAPDGSCYRIDADGTPYQETTVDAVQQ